MLKNSLYILTKKQRLCLYLAMLGWRNKKIGKFLYISDRAVEKNLQKAYKILKIEGTKNFKRTKIYALLSKQN